MDAWNPTERDLRQWASEPHSVWPDQDPELAISGCEQLDRVVLELVQDDGSPKQEFFLRVLLFAIGACFLEGRPPNPERARRLIWRASESKHPVVLAWREEAQALVEHPETFSYDDWCFGDLAASLLAAAIEA